MTKIVLNQNEIYILTIKTNHSKTKYIKDDKKNPKL